VLEAYQDAAKRLQHLDLHVFPGVKHSYMMPTSIDAYEPKLRQFSLDRAFALLDALR
jgi:carboxymethylenebutenolidase